jgi:sterol carrier protein 2
MTGIPIMNVNNNCSYGSTALFLARQAVESGSVDCALAFGFEEMKPGALGSNWRDRTSPLDEMEQRLTGLVPDAPEAPIALRVFGAAGNAYLEKYGADLDIYAKVAVKTRNHAFNNPFSMFRMPVTVKEVTAAPLMYPSLTRLMACPPSCGAAAVIVCSEMFARNHGIADAV